MRVKQTKAAPCAVDDCGGKSVSASSGQPLCTKHHQRWVTRGTVEDSPRQRVVKIGKAVIADAVATWDRSSCWTMWAELPCWEDLDGWGGKSERGYPRLGGQPVMHLVMEADGRPRPAAPANHGLHSCHNGACWNPDHLRWGTLVENVLDNVERMDYCRHCPHCNAQ